MVEGGFQRDLRIVQAVGIKLDLGAAGASAEEMNAAIDKAMSETGAASIKQMGAVVKSAKAALEGKTVDGKALSDLVRERLSKLG